MSQGMGPNGPRARASASRKASSRSRLGPNKIMIRILSIVKGYFRAYFPKISPSYQLATVARPHHYVCPPS
ncbi:hypothetical protein TNCV_2139101 [Trichonephila clavipes]|uniref:Uncharacterized protein n=1 Tax=Trichonephila clavipes TaxID=2585209 RepID=A0A8X6S4T6_TRICX|nr:hypothetical protein TNCV_2139101 [Trichonephila clavipes]